MEEHLFLVGNNYDDHLGDLSNSVFVFVIPCIVELINCLFYSSLQLL